MAQHRAVARIGRTGGKIPAQGKHHPLGRKEPHPLLRGQTGPEEVRDGSSGRGNHLAGQKGGLSTCAFCIVPTKNNEKCALRIFHCSEYEIYFSQSIKC